MAFTAPSELFVFFFFFQDATGKEPEKEPSSLEAAGLLREDQLRQKCALNVDYFWGSERERK